MKIIAASVVLFITFTLCQIVKAQPSTRTVISGATVIDGAGRAPVKNAVIVIEGNRIKQIGARGKVHLPKNAQVIDAAGKYIIPGLADMHVHPGNGFFPPGRGGAPNFKKVYAQMLAWGFTTAFSPLGPGGNDFAELKNFSARDDSPAPRFFGVGSGFTVKGGWASGLGTFTPETPGEARGQVREMKAAGGIATDDKMTLGAIGMWLTARKGKANAINKR
jgi:hypothetical protein